MWNKILAGRAQAYPSGVLTLVDEGSYPFSVRCTVQFDEARELVTFTALPPVISERQGPACLLFHRHNTVLEDQYEMMIRGELADEGGSPVFRPTAFLTGTGSPKDDQMPHATNPVQLVQFMRLGRRKAREYLAKRGTPWPPISFDNLLRALKE
jgi:hypothetical protein